MGGKRSLCQAQKRASAASLLYPTGNLFDQGFLTPVVPHCSTHRKESQPGIDYLHPGYESLQSGNDRLESPSLGARVLHQCDDIGADRFRFSALHFQSHSLGAR